jgi:hypothetical protein
VGFRKWRTTFYLDTGTAEAAANQLIDDWTNTLRNHVRESVYAYQVYATDLLPVTADYAIIPIDEGFQRGNVPTPSELYGIEYCLAVNLTVPASRPSRKFWRAGYCESDYSDGVFNNATLASDIADDFNTIISSGLYRDVDGESWTSVLVVKPSIRRLGRTAAFDVPVPPPVG